MLLTMVSGQKVNVLAELKDTKSNKFLHAARGKQVSQAEAENANQLPLDSFFPKQVQAASTFLNFTVMAMQASGKLLI